MRSRLVLAVCAVVACAACAAIAGLDDPEGESSGDAGADAIPPPEDTGAGTNDAGIPDPIAKFDLLCNGDVLKRHTCAKKRWEFDKCMSIADAGRSLVLRNRGNYTIGYIARRNWNGNDYKPAVATDGSAGEQVGYLAPGARAEIAGSYNGGTFAIVGSVRPFAEEAGTAPLDDEGKVPWKNGDFGGTPTTEIDVAQLTVTDTSECWNILNPDRRHFD